MDTQLQAYGIDIWAARQGASFQQSRQMALDREGSYTGPSLGMLGRKEDHKKHSYDCAFRGGKDEGEAS